MIRYVDILLQYKWGHWQRQGGSVVAGYPSMDVSEMMKSGGRGTGLNIDRNPEAEYLDKLILHLSKKHIKSLIARYIWAVPDWYAAEKLHTNPSTHRNRVYSAHKQLDILIRENNQFNWRISLE